MTNQQHPQDPLPAEGGWARHFSTSGRESNTEPDEPGAETRDINEVAAKQSGTHPNDTANVTQAPGSVIAAGPRSASRKKWIALGLAVVVVGLSAWVIVAKAHKNTPPSHNADQASTDRSLCGTVNYDLALDQASSNLGFSQCNRLETWARSNGATRVQDIPDDVVVSLWAQAG